jgi:transaldolase
MKRAVFLDRDGVLNRTYFHEDGKTHPPASPEEMEVLPGVLEACQALREAGFLLIVVSNQPDVARGTQSRAVVEAINEKLRRHLTVDEIRVCYHDNQDRCACRKPKPGLLLEAAGAWGIDINGSFIIGDRATDIEAGLNAGCKAVLINAAPLEAKRCRPDFQAASLSEAAEWILSAHRQGHQKLGDQIIMKRVEELSVKIFADGADKAGMLEMYANSLIKGFTTNPTLMRKAAVSDYRAFAQEIIQAIPDRPISFEVFADEFEAMERQALEISSWGDNVNVKIPVMNTKKQPSFDLLRKLARAGVRLNVTALMTLEQVREATAALAGGPHSFISVFAGRIADTGRDPVPHMAGAVEILRPHPNLELIWASPRELLNIFQADAVGCHIITVTNDVLKKLSLVGKDLLEYSLDTVKMFYNDGQQAGYHL